MDYLTECRIAVFGIGGVGGYVCEALARSGVGAFDLIDDDKVCLTNINRQIIATRKTVGQYKADVMKERILDINLQAKVNTYKSFFSHIRRNSLFDPLRIWLFPAEPIASARPERNDTAQTAEISPEVRLLCLRL